MKLCICMLFISQRRYKFNCFKNLNKWWLFITFFYWLKILSSILFDLNLPLQSYCLKNILWYPKLVFPPFSIFRYYLIARIFLWLLCMTIIGFLCAIIIILFLFFIWLPSNSEHPIVQNGRDTVWPHNHRTGWSYCVTIPSWAFVPKSRNSDPIVVNFIDIQVNIHNFLHGQI